MQGSNIAKLTDIGDEYIDSVVVAKQGVFNYTLFGMTERLMTNYQLI